MEQDALASSTESSVVISPNDTPLSDYRDINDKDSPTFETTTFSFGDHLQVSNDDNKTMGAKEDDNDLLQHEKNADEVLSKAMFYLGLSDTVQEDSDKSKQLKKNAAHLMVFGKNFESLSKTLKSMDGATEAAEDAEKLVAELKEKYEQQVQDLLNEAEGLWDTVSATAEAKTLVDNGNRLIKEWTEFGESKEAKKLVQGAASDLLEDDDTKRFLKWTSKFTKELHDDSVTVDQDILMEEIGKIRKALEEDEKVQDLFAQGRKFLEGSLNKEAKIDSDGDDDGDDNLTDDGDDGANDKDETIGDVIREYSAKGQKYLKKVGQSDRGKRMLKRSQSLMIDLAPKLRPDAVMKETKVLMSDSKQRAKFINKVKDVALDFLLTALPIIEIPAIEGYNAGVSVAYTIANLDLAGFKALARDVNVDIKDHTLSISTKYMTCNMPDLTWTYKQKSFPYFGGEGKAHAKAQDIRFNIKFTIDGIDDFNRDEDVSSLALLLDECSLTIGYLDLEVSRSWFSKLYNNICTIFNAEIKSYVQARLNEEIETSSQELLESLNSLAREYLPKFLELGTIGKHIVDKACIASPHFAREGKKLIDFTKKADKKISDAASIIEDKAKLKLNQAEKERLHRLKKPRRYPTQFRRTQSDVGRKRK